MSEGTRGHLRLLLWLRYRTLARRRSRGAWIGLTLGVLLVGVPLSLGAAALVAAGTRWAASRPEPWFLAEWTQLLLLLLWLLFLGRSVLGFGANEFYDITKLFHLPVRHGTVFLAQTIGMLLSGGTLFFLPALVALAVALPGSGAVTAVRAAVVLLFLLHGVVLGQLLQLVFLNLLRSRRFRDLAPILAALVSGGVYLLFRFLSGPGDPREVVGSLLSVRLSRWLSPLPPHWTGSVLLPGAGAGYWLLFLGAFLPLTALAMWLASLLQERAFSGEIPTSRREGRAVRTRAGGERRARFPLSLVPGPARAVAAKELRLLRREPVVKTTLITQFVYFVVPIGIAIFAGRGAETWVVYLLLYVESVLVLNLYGLEGGGIVHSALTPAPRDLILLGKLLAYLLVWGVLNLAVLAGLLAVLAALGRPRGPESVALLMMESAAGLLVLLGIGAVVSPSLPVRLTAAGRSALAQAQAGRSGCARSLMGLLAMLLLAVLLAPVAVVARGLDSVPLTAAGLVYAFAVFMAGYRIGARRYEDREARLVAALARSPD